MKSQDKNQDLTTVFATIISQIIPFGAARRIQKASVATLPQLFVCVIFEVSVNNLERVWCSFNYIIQVKIMASRIVYTSTITVPVYASWRCEECGEINFAIGAIVVERQESSSSWRPSKQREAEAKAASLAQAEWAGETLQIISDPNNYAQDMRNSLFLQNTHCTKCGKKPKWDKNMNYLTWSVRCFMLAIISGIAANAIGTSPVAWLIFAAFLAIGVTAFISESRYMKMMENLPKKHTPVIGSLNPELIEYAEALGKKIPNPDECIATVKGYDQVATGSARC